MRSFSQLEVHLGRHHRESTRKAFLIRSCAVCSYIERHLATSTFPVERSRLNIVCLTGTEQPKIRPYEHQKYILGVEIPYAMPAVSKLSLAELHKHYRQVISDGLEAASEYMPVPYEFCMTKLDDFCRKGYVNQWIVEDKTWTRLALRSTITARVNTERFSLQQTIWSKGVRVANQVVANCSPRQFLWYQYLGKAVVNSAGEIILRRGNSVISVFDPNRRVFSKTSCDV
ncbi:MAG: hypothetical protein AAF750_05175 [Planctomycetota bacterium]